MNIDIGGLTAPASLPRQKQSANDQHLKEHIQEDANQHGKMATDGFRQGMPAKPNEPARLRTARIIQLKNE